MERQLAFAGILFAIALGAAPCPALAQMGYGGYGGNTGGSRMTSPIPLDDYAQGMRAMHAQKFADAIPHLERASMTRPHNAEILCQLGIANVMVGNYQLAYGWLQKALAEDPDHKAAHETLGVVYLVGNDPAHAQDQLAELVRLCPDSCGERDRLAKVIADYVAAHPAAAPTAPAAPPAAAPATGTR
jgi:tetratricopeptide (TPR) repeat protein